MIITIFFLCQEGNMKIILKNKHGIFDFEDMATANEALPEGWQKQAYFTNEEDGKRCVCIGGKNEKL